jgi:hypothetical protein
MTKKNKLEEQHPLPPGAHLINLPEPDPKEVKNLFQRLYNSLNPRQKKLIEKLRKGERI